MIHPRNVLLALTIAIVAPTARASDPPARNAAGEDVSGAMGLVGATPRPLTGSIAAVSVGLVAGTAVLDLDYPEDSTAQTDMNVVMTGDGRFVEVQGTAEGEPFDRAVLGGLLDLATVGCERLTALQQAALDGPARERLA